MRFAKFSVVSSLAIAACMSAPAFAQDTTEDTEGRSTTNTILVTAEFREANLQDTPIAITAVNAEMLEARGVTDVSQIAAQAPNVTLKPQGQGGGSGLIAYIRGVGQTDFIYARDPGVGVYIDDVYIPTLQSSLIELMDLERVEVLRGPQGTLAGKNSIGGSIRLFGQRPEGDNSGSLDISYGSYNDIRVRGMADFALTEDLAVRISGMSRNTDGYVDVVDYGLTHPTSNVPSNQSIGQFPQLAEAGGRHVTAARIALEWEPSDRLNVYMTADYTNQDGDPGAEVLIAAGAPAAVGFNPNSQNPATSVWTDGTTLFTVPWLAGRNGNTVTVGCQFVPAGPFSCDTPPSGYDPRYLNYANYLDAMEPNPQAPYKPYYAVPRNTFEGWGVHSNVTFDVNDNLQLVWISSYREYESTWAFDQDLTPVPIAQLNNINQHWAWSQELRANFELADGLIEGTVGGFYFDQYGDYEARVDLNYVGHTIDFIHGPDETPSESKAVFINLTVNPTEALSITGGLRYSDESKDYTYFRRNPDYTAPNAGACFANPGGFAGFNPDGSPIGPPGAVPSTLDISPNCLLVGFLGTEGNFADDRIDWRTVVNYRFSDQFMVYGSVATGFKGGGVNPRPFVPDQALPFNPETLTTYEIGMKADLWDRRVRLNGAVFYNEYADIQGTQLVCPGSALPFPCLRPANVGSAEMRGFELEAQVFPADGLSFDASFAYLDFEYTSVLDANGNLVGTSIPGTAITPYTPEISYAIGMSYEHELASGSTVRLRLDGSYQDEIFTTSENTPFSRIDDYFLANGRVTFTSPDEAWSFYAEVQNIFDEYYFLTVSDASNSLGIVSGAPGLPRTWRLGARREF